MTIKINNAFIRKIARDNPPKVREFRDTNLRGFVVRQQPSGFIAYYAVVFRGSTRRGNRRQRKWRIGEHPAIGPSEARKLAEEIIGQARLDNLPIEKELERWQLGDFLDSHYRPWATQHLKAPKGQEGQLRRFGHWRHLYLDEFDRLLVENWRGQRLACGISPNTVNRNVCVIRAVLSKAVEWGFLKHHPLEGLKPLRIDRGRQPRMLTEEERQRLFTGLMERDEQLIVQRRSANEWRRLRGYNLYPDLPHFGDHLTPIILIAYYTGMRRGEVFSLHWRDVNWNAKTITVQGDGSKTSQTRVMPMNGPLHEALDKWHQQADETTGLVFPGRRGERFDNIKKSWDALRRKCGLESIKFKDFRSDFGSRLANNGVDLAVTQRLLGHSSPVVTMRYYISIQDQTMRDAVSTVI